MSDETDAPLRTATTAAALAERLRRDIDRGRWGAGEVLRQENLAAEFGVSRIPIREALAQLQAEGLVAIEHHRGARIARPSAAEIDEIFDLRLTLESDMLARALPHHDARSLRGLKRLQEALEDEDERLGWINGDRAFHAALYRPADRPRSLRLYRQLRGPVDRFSVRRLTPDARRHGWAREHRALIDAVQARDVTAALGALAGHLDETRAVVIAALASMKED